MHVATANTQGSIISMDSRRILPVASYIDFPDNPLEVYQAKSSDAVMQIRVDWDGDIENLGVFAVLCGDDEWRNCGNLNPESSSNDLILVQPQANYGKFTIKLTRGPNNQAIPFEAWARAIQWTLDPESSSEYSSPSFIPQREVHYQYSTGSIYKHQASTLVDGVQEASLELETTKSYELWTKLRHPSLPNIWCIQDPVVDPTEPPVGSDPTYKNA